MKKVLIVVMVCLLLAGALFAGCKSNETTEPAAKETEAKSETVDEKEPEVVEEAPKQERPVHIMNHLMGGKDPDEYDLWDKRAYELSGIEVKVTKVSGGDMSTKISTSIAAGDDVDIVIVGGAMFETLLDQNVLEVLTERIANSPVLSDPEVIPPAYWEEVRRNGELYGVFNKYEGGRLGLVRGDWMEKLNIAPPKSLDDYYNMFKAFKEQDPDGNGEADTYGFTMKHLYDIQPFMSSQGLHTGYAQDADGKWYMPWASDKAAVVYDWLGVMYDEGLMDPNFATNGSSNCRELILSSKCGMMTYWDYWAESFNKLFKADDPETTKHMVGVPPALDENGNGILTAPFKEQWVIFNYSDNIDYAFKFLEFMHTNDGIGLCTLGIEGYDYTVENGVYTQTEIGKEHNNDHGMHQVISSKWENPFGMSKEFEDARDIVAKYSKVEITKDTTDEAYDIVVKYGVQAIMGEMTGAEAVAKMQEELRSQKYID